MQSFILIFTLLLIGCQVPAQQKFTPPADWIPIRSCAAEYFLPPELKEVPVRGIDSCVKKYRSEASVLMLDILAYQTPDASRKDEYAYEQDFKYVKTKIDNRKAEIITCYEKNAEKDAEGLDYLAVLFVPQMSAEGGNLTIWLRSKSPEEREKAMKLFQTLRFSKE